ncbi:uncharacterized protein M421DRAFT_325321 [Didymella exigua CBS 183.55]|uniref:histidine kinase n=1 Tax=Didymella exigua CBS 183.55 TaxID=1150837 RepID=A0A6A5R8A7_9PLEO|nr:uncharacterized protein M421DRAFT_325321 [Didymella exigua CBS 183.55]KAF1923450.1 hypothetical protein M421DRAFT_325321 [Didymella exigua CBS 183.55]
MAAGKLACADSAQTFDPRERASACDIASYLSAASFPVEGGGGPSANPVPSTDVVLNALVQHGAHAVECDRAFLSFVDAGFQFVCAEMTRHQSIVDACPTRPLLLGTTRIALDWGVCSYAMSASHGSEVTVPESPYIAATESYFCVRDFRRVPAFAALPFVAGYPRMVSSIEIPLRSHSGHVLGSYCIVDDKVRDFLHPDALRAVREAVSAITQYIDLKRAEQSRMRSQRVMDGLGRFIASHDHKQADSTQTTSPFALGIFENVSRPGFDSRSSGNTDSYGDRDCLTNANAEPGHVLMSDSGLAPGTTEVTTVSPQQDDVSKQREPGLLAQVGDLLPKAANMIGRAMNLDGFVFFDAVDTGARYGAHGSSYSHTDDEFAQHAHEKLQSSAQPLSVYRRNGTTESPSLGRFTQSFIRRLTAAYPHGHLFKKAEHVGSGQGLQEAKDCPRSSGTSAPHQGRDEVFDCIPKARHVIFLPLWHYQRESSFLNALAWVSDPSSTLEADDVNLLTVFGNSLMAEIFRLEAATVTQQKSDFISSVSHELRSPLHGILATVELMKETLQDPFLLSLTQMIESCSCTLLDTFSHLLEFSKINSLKGERESAARAKCDAESPPKRTPANDLSSLVEDVLQAVSLGHNSVSQMELGLQMEYQDPLVCRVQVPAQPVLITTHIDHNSDWISSMDPGAWKRILLNIFSNALRFTASGHIDVTLRLLDDPDAGPRCISLSVADSGVGMSREFLKYHLFTPFMQENNLIPGTGLGLNIVKNIVESLDGRMFVESRQHQGTRVTVNIPHEAEPGTLGTPDIRASLAPYGKAANLTFSLISIASQTAPDSKPGPHLVAPPRLLKRCLRNICGNYFGMIFVDDAPLDALLESDLILLDTYALSSTEMLHLHEHFPRIISAMASRPIIVLGPTAEGARDFFGRKGATFISSPITRRILWDAVDTALAKVIPVEAIPHPTAGIKGQDPSQQVAANPPGVSLTRDKVKLFQGKSINVPTRGARAEADPSAQGNTFPTLTLHRSPSSQPPHTAAPEPQNQLPKYRYRRLLLVDDNPINLRLLAAFIRGTGLLFSTAYDGAEAVRLYRKAAVEEADPFDCVLMDISMPVMDGFQAAAAIRQFEAQQRGQRQDRVAATHEARDPAGRHEHQGPRGVLRSHIVALTGLGSEAARSMARESGFNLFLVKPVQFKDLEPLLKTLPANGKT